MTRIVRLSQTEIEKKTGIKDAFRTPIGGITRRALRDGPFDNLRHLKGARGWGSVTVRYEKGIGS
jgi:hypothetical protein